jgi:RND superfamily putative drug exporter
MLAAGDAHHPRGRSEAGRSGHPALAALTAICHVGLIAIPSLLVPIDETVYELILLIGLAVGVDYSLFYLKREREERAAGRSEAAALEAAAATSGRSVLISGLTVIIAMAGMFFAGIQGMTEFGLGTIMVVAVAMVGSLTVLPAVLSKLGDRVDRGRVPFVGRLRRDGSDGRIWGAIIDRVLRRPLVSIVLSGGLLVALALPALQLHIVNASPETFPADLPVIKTYKQLQKSFPGDGIPATVVVKADDVRSPEAQSAIADLKRRALASDQLNGPITVDINRAGTVASISVPVDGSGSDSASNVSLAVLRDDIVPATVDRIPGAEVGVSGFTAQSKDFSDKIKAVAPLVFGFVLVFALGLLLFAFRSLVIAVKAIVLNLLSVAAPTASSCSCSSMASARGCSASTPPPASTVPADLHLRDPVRAFDGLPRVHPEPDPRGLRPRHEHRAGDHHGIKTTAALSPAPRS